MEALVHIKLVEFVDKNCFIKFHWWRKDPTLALGGIIENNSLICLKSEILLSTIEASKLLLLAWLVGCK